MSAVSRKGASLLVNNLLTLVRNHSVLETTSKFRFKWLKAAVLHELKEKLKLGHVIRKKLREEEVRVKVGYCNLNQSDLLMCRGEYDFTPDLPFVPGHEISGEIVEVGSKASKDLAVGMKVVGLSKNNYGGLAQEVILSSTDVWELPQSIKLNTGCVLADSYTTALLGLVRRGRIRDTHTVLVTAAAGGLGLAAVDLAANVYLAKVIAVCGTEKQASLLRKRGAWAALVYEPKEVIKIVNRVTDGRGVDLVFDAIGGEIFEHVSKCVAHEGRFVIAGFASRKMQKISTGTLLPKSMSLTGISLSAYRTADTVGYRESVQDSIDLCEQRLITPVISKIFPLENVNSAVEYLESEQTTGNVVVQVTDDD